MYHHKIPCTFHSQQIFAVGHPCCLADTLGWVCTGSCLLSPSAELIPSHSSTSATLPQQAARATASGHPLMPPKTLSPSSKWGCDCWFATLRLELHHPERTGVANSGVIFQGNTLKSHHTQQVWLLKQVPAVLYHLWWRISL